MNTARLTLLVPVALLVLAAAAACSDANDQLIGAECTAASECENEELTCLTQFKGGYCGAAGCQHDADCPDGSICVDQDGQTFCFLVCTEKEQCNEHRDVEVESNCSSSILRVDGGTAKACVPPTGN